MTCNLWFVRVRHVWNDVKIFEGFLCFQYESKPHVCLQLLIFYVIYYFQVLPWGQLPISTSPFVLYSRIVLDASSHEIFFQTFLLLFTPSLCRCQIRALNKFELVLSFSFCLLFCVTVCLVSLLNCKSLFLKPHVY